MQRAEGGERSAKGGVLRAQGEKHFSGLVSRVSDCRRLQNGRFRDEERRNGKTR